jgi:PBSX family phage portal protein
MIVLSEEENVIDGTDEQVSAYVYTNGEVVDVHKSFFDQVTNYDTVGKKKKKGTTNSMDLDIDDWGEQYSAGRVYHPPLSLLSLKQFSLENLHHARCIKQKSIDSCGGFKIAQVDRVGNVISDDNTKLVTKDYKLYDFFNNCTIFDDFIELSRQIAIDFQTFGLTCLEMTRNRKGEPTKFYHLPPETCRISRDLRDLKLVDTDQKYVVQVVHTHVRVFKIFDGVRPTVAEPTTGNLMTEVLILRNYHVSGLKYGIPDWVPALKAMLGNDKVAEYNINFFNNEAVPRFAVIVQGGKLDDETKRDIKSYFKKDLKGVANAHKTLVLTTPKGTEVKLVPLAVEIKDGGFRFYRKDNRDETISAHGVPPHRIQVYDSGHSGALAPGMIFNLDKAYKYSVIQPLQQKLAASFNQILKLGFGIKDRRLVYTPLDIGEDQQRAETLKTIAGAHEKYYNMGTMTPDEIRVDNKQTPYADDQNVAPDVKEWATTPKPVYLLRQQQAMIAAQAMDPNNPDGPQNGDTIRSSGGGTKMNSAGGNVNETSNDFNDKSKEQTKNFDDKQLKQVLMKSALDMTEVIQKVDQALSSISDLSEVVIDHLEEGK